MGRRVKFLLLVCLSLSLPLLVGFTRTTTQNVNYELHTTESAEDILDELESVLPPEYSELVTPSVLSEATKPERLISEIFLAARSELFGALEFFGLALSAALMLSLASLVTERGAELALSIFVGVPLWNSLLTLFESVLASLSSASDFFLGASGVVCALTLSSGAAATAAAASSALSLTLSVFGEVGTGALGALTSAVIGTSLLGAVLGGRCETVARGVRSVFGFGLGIVTAALLGLFSLQSFVAAASDSAALRAAKYAASGMIPVVGGTVSGAISTLAAGLSFVGSIVGASSVLVIVLIALVPALRLLLFRLALSTVLAFLDFTDSASGKRLILSLRGALDSVSALYFLSCLVYIFEIILFIKSVTGIL